MNGYFAYDAGWLEQRHALHTAREIWQQPDLWAALHQQLQQQQTLWQPFLTPLLATPTLAGRFSVMMSSPSSLSTE